MERSKRSLNVRMKHDDDDGVNEDSNWSRLEPDSVCVCVYLTRKTVKRQRH